MLIKSKYEYITKIYSYNLKLPFSPHPETEQNYDSRNQENWNFLLLGYIPMQVLYQPPEKLYWHIRNNRSYLDHKSTNFVDITLNIDAYLQIEYSTIVETYNTGTSIIEWGCFNSCIILNAKMCQKVAYINCFIDKLIFRI